MLIQEYKTAWYIKLFTTPLFFWFIFQHCYDYSFLLYNDKNFKLCFIVDTNLKLPYFFIVFNLSMSWDITSLMCPSAQRRFK